METLTSRRFLFAHKNLSHATMDKAAPRSHKYAEGRARHS
jgi:hypothetical protein